MGVARDVAKQSMALTEARDRDGWLGLFADDAVVEDPVGPSMLDPEGKGRVGKAAITDFYDNVITTSEKIEFTIRDSYECGNEVANVGQIRITLPGGQVGIVPIVNIYKVNDAGQLLSLRSFWEADKLSFSEG
jgi:ketosteroid isomerase-like protein